MAEDANELDDGPNVSSERRFKSPTRAPATKRKNHVHAEEPDTKKSTVGDLTDDENYSDIDSLRAKQEDMQIVSQAIIAQGPVLGSDQEGQAEHSHWIAAMPPCSPSFRNLTS